MRTAPISTPRSLGDGLREFRISAGLSQRELASIVGFDQRHIAELEGGKATKAVLRLFEYLRAVDARIVIQGTDDGGA